MAKKTPKIGDMMKDGTVFAGISPDTKQAIYMAPADGRKPLLMKFNQAAEYAKDLEIGGKRGFRIPSKGELDVLYQNREKGALKKAFNQSGQFPAGYYWTSSPFYCFFFDARAQRMSDGKQCHYNKARKLSVSCVRS